VILAMEPMTNSRIKTVVLRRARFIYTVRPFLSGTVLGLVVAGISLYALGREVWVARVLENIPVQAGALAVLRFFEVAFMNTTFAVQVLSVLLVFGVLWIARDAARTISMGVRYA